MSFAGLPAGFTIAEQPKPAPASYHGLPEGFEVQPQGGSSWGDALAAAPGAALDEIGGAAKGVAKFFASLPDDPLGYKIGRAIKAAPGAVGHELGGMAQFVRNLSPPEYRGTDPTYEGGEVQNHPWLSLMQGDTDSMKHAVATQPLGLVGDVASAAGLTAPGRFALGKLSDAALAGPRKIGPQLAASEALPLEDALLVRKYEQMGGHLRPGQYSPSNFLRQGDSVISDAPWPRAAGFKSDSPTAIHPRAQAEEFNRFLSRSFGEDAPRITDQVVQNARERIGHVYETVLPRNSIRASEPLAASLGEIEKNVAQAAPAMNAPDVVRVQNVLEAIRRQVTDSSLPGTVYQAYRQRGGILDELAGSGSPVLQRAGTDIRRALDDAFAHQANEWDAPALKAARDQYRALETIAPLAAKAPAGNINPGLLLNVVNKEFGSPGNAGELGTLARVGSAFLKAQPSSGTSERSTWRTLINEPVTKGVPAVLNSAVTLPISLLHSRQVNRLINSPEMRARLLARALEAENTGATTVSAPPR